MAEGKGAMALATSVSARSSKFLEGTCCVYRDAHAQILQCSRGETKTKLGSAAYLFAVKSSHQHTQMTFTWLRFCRRRSSRQSRDMMALIFLAVVLDERGKVRIYSRFLGR